MRKTIENKELIEMFNDVLDKAEELGYNVYTTPKFTWLNSTKRWGQFTWNGSLGLYEISLNTCFNEEPKKALQTIIHEVGHFLTVGHNHDCVWKQVTNNLAKEYGKHCNRCTSSKEMGIELAQNAKYAVYCPKCGHVWTFERMCNTVKFPKAYRHKSCGATLERKW